MDRQKWMFRAVAWPAWLVAAANVIPQVDPHITPAMSTLAVGAGVASTLAFVVRDCQRPVSQIWESGREYGRREAMWDTNVSAVVQLADARERRRAGQDMAESGT